MRCVCEEVPNEDASRLLTDGYVVLRGCYGADDVRERVRTLCGGTTYESVRRRFVDEDLALGASRTNFRIEDKASGELMCARVDDLLRRIGSDSAYEWYDSSIIVAIPGKGRQPAHRDYRRPPSSDGEWKIVVFSPKKDVAHDGGETVVYPRTHLCADDPEATTAAPNAERVRLYAGDALVFFSSLVHYGDTNSTGKYRILFSQTYTKRNLRF